MNLRNPCSPSSKNVLLVNTNADHLKVGDFGLSKIIRVLHSHDVYKFPGETGSYRYMAPEVFNHRKYDKKVDVFSFAMILYEMLEGDSPMSNYEPYEAARYVAEGHRPMLRAKGFIPCLRELIEQCWAADMNERPSFLEILRKLEKIKEVLPSDHSWNIFASSCNFFFYQGGHSWSTRYGIYFVNFHVLVD
ncbi:hypothetical protein ACS0TY_022131 [Phlomoides rotata]